MSDRNKHRVAITGHTAGIGGAIFERLTPNPNFLVFGFSRTNNFELPQNKDKMLRLVQELDIDIFINNWFEYHTDFQSRLLTELYDQWLDQDKMIINIGSRASDSLIRAGRDDYSLYKALLDNTCTQLNHEAHRLPRVANVRAGYVDTQSVENVAAPKLNPTVVADMVEFIINQPSHVCISDISLHHLPK